VQGAAGIEALIDRHGRELHVFLWRMLRDGEDAEDCLQETYLRAYRALPRLAPDANHRAWLYAIAANVGRSWLRKRRSADRLGELQPVHPPRLEEDLADRLEAVSLRAAVDRLPPRQREALILRKYQGLDYVTIAAVQGNTQEAARANVYQALRRLRALLQATEEPARS
jgi:RNA polymerase sigma-70 factor (ECF subfamily)